MMRKVFLYVIFAVDAAVDFTFVLEAVRVLSAAAAEMPLKEMQKRRQNRTNAGKICFCFIKNLLGCAIM